MVYAVVEENVEEVGEFEDEVLWRPKYRCSNCSRAIQKGYISTSGECYDCNNGNTAVGTHVQKVYAMTVYISDAEYTDLAEGIFDLKDQLENVEEFAEILEQGITEDFPLSNPELLVVPPSGTADEDEENHMLPIGEELSSISGIPFRDIVFKTDDFQSQKELGVEERLKNVKGKIGCTADSIEADTVLVIDDIATSCATISATAQAVIESGANQAYGLVIARDETLSNLEFTNVVREKED